MRTLSARILLGFIALTITFGVFTATIVRDLREAGDEATRILDGYVPIALASGELARNQHDLKQYLDEKLPDAVRANAVEKAITGFRNKRRAALAEIDKKIDGLNKLVSSSGQSASDVDEQLPVTARIVDEIKLDLVKVDGLYETLLAAPPLRVPPPSDPGFQAAYDALDPPRKLAYDALQELRKEENRMSYTADDLQDRGKRRMVPTRSEEHTSELQSRVDISY